MPGRVKGRTEEVMLDPGLSGKIEGTRFQQFPQGTYSLAEAIEAQEWRQGKAPGIPWQVPGLAKFQEVLGVPSG